MLRKVLFALALLFLVPVAANAAARFAVCTTTCTWDGASTAMWSTTSGGATGASVPGSADTVTFDANTCVGGTTCTTTVNTTVSIAGFTIGACTASTTGCIIDFSVNNNNVTIAGGFSATGTGTRTLNMGNGVWTMVGNGLQWNFLTTTNLTLNVNSSSVVLQATSGGNMQFFGGGKSWGPLTLDATANGAGYIGIEPGNSANNTFASCTFKAPGNFTIRSGTTQTCTGGFTTVGSSASNSIFITGDNVAGSAATLAVGSASSCSYCAFRNITGATSAITATNSLNLGSNSGTLSITGPTGGGGGGYIIGGQ